VELATDTVHAANERAPSLDGTRPRRRRRLAALTDEQIALLQAALSYWERSTADTSYDPQVGEWARTHSTGTGATAAAIRKALASSTWESDW
jgi:hypothetical protein